MDQEIEYLEAEKTRLLKEIEQHKFTIESCTPATKQDLKRIYGV